MSISILLAEKIAQLFLILLMGYLVVRVGLLRPEDSRVLSVIMVYLVMPCMILNAFQIDNTPEVRTGIVYSFVVAGIMHLLFLALTALLKKPLKLDVIERCAVIYSNASALVIPLLEATLGSEYVVYSCGFIIVQLVLLWTHCCTVLRGDKGIDLKKIVTNLNLIAIVAAALLFALHITLPAGLVTTISSVGNMIGPLGMLLAGMAIASSPLKKLVLTPRYYLTVFLRLILYPMVTLGLLWLLKAQTWIPDGKAILMTVFLSGITPVCSALNSMVQLYDRDMEESGALYVLTTLLSIVTMPLVIAVFERVM